MLEGISGTVHTAEQAATISKTDVTVLDSGTTDRALALQVIEAAKLAQQGASKEEVLAGINKVRTHTKLFMGVMTLSNLVKGGRISRVTGAISSLLNIKIVLQVGDGNLDIRTKGRGAKPIDKYFDQVIAQMKDLKVNAIGISHVNAMGEVKRLTDQLQPMFPNVDILVRETVPIIATHGGPGAFALIYSYD